MLNVILCASFTIRATGIGYGLVTLLERILSDAIPGTVGRWTVSLRIFFTMVYVRDFDRSSCPWTLN